jgi:ATP-dependent RNA helicase DeaD
MNSFENSGLHDEIVQAVREMGFEMPTPIQAKAIPHLLSSNEDLIAFAQTGTGKTAAFGLPGIQLTSAKDPATQLLILCPTRELCVQITKDLTNFSKYIKGLSIVAVYGGAGMDAQIRALSKNAQIVVGTPGRVKDLILRRKLVLSKVNRVVLDEADEMLSMGFKDDLDAILAETPREKQTLLFSATMSKEVAAIARKYMHHPVEIAAAPVNTGVKNVQHLYYMVHAKDKYELLKRIADSNPSIYGIVFCRTRQETKEIANKLMQDGYNADALHGDLSQAQRDEAMGRFRTRQLQLLVATDVAARGLDVNDLTHVINFSLPDDNEVYLHRSGRTGRAGKTGISIAIAHMREIGKIRDIERTFGIKFSKELAPSGRDICQKQLYLLIDKIETVQVDELQIAPFLPDIYKKLESLSREDLIKQFVSAEFNRFLDYYRNAKDINVVESGKAGRKEKGSEKGGERALFSRLFVNVGAKNGLHPARLLGIINESLNSREVRVGKIEILKKFSFFEVEKGLEAPLIEALTGKMIDGVHLLVEVSQENPAEVSSYRRNTPQKKEYKGYKEKRDRGVRRKRW